MRAEGYSAPSGGYWVGGGWDILGFRFGGGVGWVGVGGGIWCIVRPPTPHTPLDILCAPLHGTHCGAGALLRAWESFPPQDCCTPPSAA